MPCPKGHNPKEKGGTEWSDPQVREERDCDPSPPEGGNPYLPPKDWRRKEHPPPQKENIFSLLPSRRRNSFTPTCQNGSRETFNI